MLHNICEIFPKYLIVLETTMERKIFNSHLNIAAIYK